MGDSGIPQALLLDDIIPTSFRKITKAEKKLAEERQAARAHKYESDPYIITGEVVGVDGFDNTEMGPDYVNQIPLETLPISSLPVVEEQSNSDEQEYYDRKGKNRRKKV